MDIKKLSNICLLNYSGTDFMFFINKALELKIYLFVEIYIYKFFFCCYHLWFYNVVIIAFDINWA